MTVREDRSASRERLNVLVITGRDHFHHRWRSGSARLRAILEESGRFNVRITEVFDGATDKTLADFDVVVLCYFGGSSPGATEHRWGAATEQALLDFVAGGKGLVVPHSAFWMGASWGAEAEPFERMFGGAMRPTSRRAPGDGVAVKIVRHDHPITIGLPAEFFAPRDDKYVNLHWHRDARPEILAVTEDPPEAYLAGAYYAVKGEPGPKLYDLDQVNLLEGVGTQQPTCWTHAFGSGRVFALCIGHVGASTIEDAHLGQDKGIEIGPTVDASTHTAEFRTLFARGTEWAASARVTLPLATGP